MLVGARGAAHADPHMLFFFLVKHQPHTLFVCRAFIAKWGTSKRGENPQKITQVKIHPAVGNRNDTSQKPKR